MMTRAAVLCSLATAALAAPVPLNQLFAPRRGMQVAVSNMGSTCTGDFMMDIVMVQMNCDLTQLTCEKKKGCNGGQCNGDACKRVLLPLLAKCSGFSDPTKRLGEMCKKCSSSDCSMAKPATKPVTKPPTVKISACDLDSQTKDNQCGVCFNKYKKINLANKKLCPAGTKCTKPPRGWSGRALPGMKGSQSWTCQEPAAKPVGPIKCTPDHAEACPRGTTCQMSHAAIMTRPMMRDLTPPMTLLGGRRTQVMGGEMGHGPAGFTCMSSSMSSSR